MSADQLDYMAVKAARGLELSRRYAAHEIGHAIVGRALGSIIELVTIVPHGDFAGRCVRRGVPSTSLNLLDEKKVGAATPIKMPTTADLVEVCERIGTPEVGTPRVDLAEEITRGVTHIIELVGAGICELVMFPDLPPLPAEHDRIEARALASIVCASPSAIGALLSYAEAEAEAIIRTNRDVVEAAIDAIVVKGELSGEELDKIISAGVAGRALAAEKERQRWWQGVLANASAFEAELHRGDRA